VPEPHIVRSTAKIYDLQEPTAKMSKSAASPNGLIELLDDPLVVAKRIRSAVTDTDREVRFDVQAKPGVSNLLSIYSALTGRTIADLEASYEGKGYGDLKKDLADVVVAFLEPFQTRFRELMDDPAHLDDVLAVGAEKAREIAAPVLARVYDRSGLLPARRAAVGARA
jgi:tryptophanyl-tRNA synthetase